MLSDEELEAICRWNKGNFSPDERKELLDHYEARKIRKLANRMTSAAKNYGVSAKKASNALGKIKW